MDRDEAIKAADEIIAGLNDEVTGMDPEAFKLWHPTESERPGLSKLDASRAIMERIPSEIQSVVDDIRSTYNRVSGSGDSTIEHGAQVVQQDLGDLETFANEVIPQAATTFEGAAETADSTYQFIRDANAQSRNTIANSRAGNGGFFTFANPIVGGSGEVLNDDSMLTTNTDQIEQGIDNMQQSADEFTKIVDGWAGPGGRTPGKDGGVPDFQIPSDGPERGDTSQNGTGNGGGVETYPYNPDTSGGSDSDSGSDMDSGDDSTPGKDFSGTENDVEAPELDTDIPTPSLGGDDSLGLDTPELGDTGTDTGLGADGGAGGLDLPEYGGGGSSFMSPDVPDPQLGNDSLGLDSDADNGGSGWEAPETSLDSDGVDTQTSGWTPAEEDEEDAEDVDALFDDLDEDGDGPSLDGPGGDDGADGPDVDSDGEGRDVDGAEPQGTEEDDESGSGVFDTDLDNPGGGDSDLPEGGASDVDDPELGQASTAGSDGQWEPPAADDTEGEGSDEEVTAKIAGEDITFPDEATAEVAETMNGDNPMPLREAAADAGFEVPGEGEDIGSAVDPIDAQPGDVIVSEDGDYLYLGDERALGPDGEVREFEDGEFPAFSDAHQGFFRMDSGDGEGLEPTAGATAPGEPEMAQASANEPSEAGEPVERRDDAPVGLGAGQFTPETDTETTGHTDGGEDADESVPEPVLEAEDPEDGEGTPGISDGEDDSGSQGGSDGSASDDDGLGSAGSEDADSDGDSGSGDSDNGESGDADSDEAEVDPLIGGSGDEAGTAAGSTGSSVAGGSVTESDEALDPDQVAP